MVGKIIENKIPLGIRLRNGGNIETEDKKLDLNLLKKRGNSKTYKSLLIQKMKEARESKNFEVCQLIEWCYKKYLEFETHEKVVLNSWKNKSGIKLINKPDKIIVIRHQKLEIGEEPREIKEEISKQEINNVIKSINKLKEEFNNKIPTSAIAEDVFHVKWGTLFATRPEHIRLTHILNVLDIYGLTKYYKRGFTQIIKEVREIQEVLE